MRRLALPVALALALAGCNGESAPKGDALVVVSAPLNASPWIGDFVVKGAELAVAQVNRGHDRHLRLEVLDNEGSAQTTVANARRAVSEGAVAFITDGVGAKAVAAVTDPVSLPVFITFEGGSSLVDPKTMPSIFRLAPANTDLCRRLADYLADVRRGRPIALLSDDSAYGVEGAAEAKADLLHDELAVVAEGTIPSGARDVSAQVLAARRSGAKVLVVWARAAGIAAVIRTARSSGWDVPVYTGPAGEDPLVRQQLADHPQWLDGTVFVSFRITSEAGGEPFAAYRAQYEKAYGPGTFGVKSDGKLVVQPPDWSMYSYDAVNLVAAALNRAKAVDRKRVYDGIQALVITGANGDERGFGPDDREGVSPDDMYFGYFKGMRFYPKLDDTLSTSLPIVAQ